MSRTAFSALTFFFVLIVTLAGNDESNVSAIQTGCLVRAVLTAYMEMRIAEVAVVRKVHFRTG
jgi:hypothetical protein